MQDIFATAQQLDTVSQSRLVLQSPIYFWPLLHCSEEHDYFQDVSALILQYLHARNLKLLTVPVRHGNFERFVWNMWDSSGEYGTLTGLQSDLSKPQMRSTCFRCFGHHLYQFIFSNLFEKLSKFIIGEKYFRTRLERTATLRRNSEPPLCTDKI